MRPGPAEADAIKMAVTGRMMPGDDIIAAGCVGNGGTLELIQSSVSGRLKDYFTLDFLENARQTCLAQYILKNSESAREIWSEAASYGAHALYYPGKAGFLGGLWILAEASGTGLKLDLRKVPVLQYTIEVCERTGRDPYKIPADGMMMISMPSGERFAADLNRRGILTAVVGQANASAGRLLYSGTLCRFLNKPEKELRPGFCDEDGWLRAGDGKKEMQVNDKV